MRLLVLVFAMVVSWSGAQALVSPPAQPFAGTASLSKLFGKAKISEIPDDFVPYPWGYELPFPWSLAQGMWTVKTNHFDSFFTFQVVRERSSNEKQLMIRQYDPSDCTEVAAGVGVERSNKIIWAQMKAYNSPNAYRLGLRSFSIENFPKVVLPTTEGHVMVLSLAQVGSVETKHFPLSKISNSFKDVMNQCRVIKVE